MTMKKPTTIKEFSPGTAPKLNQNLDVLYYGKLESRWKRESSGITSYIYQSMETGEVTFSSTGSATISKSFGFKERMGTVVFAIAHSQNINTLATVTDITNTGLTIECRTVSGTADFSAVTTASFSVFFQAIGSSP